MDRETLLQLDARHVWHPYASMPNTVDVYPVASAEAAVITLTDGTRLLDGMSSWWSAIHGYNHPVLNQAISGQLAKMAHVMFGGFTHEPAVTLAKKLVDITPAPLQKVFFSDSGSVAVEVAIKMALQYWQARGKSAKNRLLALQGGYHGDTFAAMAVCDPVTGMHHLFNQNLPQHYFTERPGCRFNEACNEKDISHFRHLINRHHQQLAAVILEPIVQGAGGMWFYSPQYLQQVRRLCDEYDVLLICDEIATGFGRSGKLFACEHAAIAPDILCLGKALTGGYLTLAATLCNDKVAQGLCQGEAGVLMHGPTFMANPLACAVANASIDLLSSGSWQQRVMQLQQQLTEGLAAAQQLPGVAEVRVLGAIGVIEMKQPVNMQAIQPLFVQQGIWLRPFGKLVYMMPPYIMEKDQVAILCQGTLKVLSQYLADQP